MHPPLTAIQSKECLGEKKAKYTEKKAISGLRVDMKMANTTL